MIFSPYRSIISSVVTKKVISMSHRVTIHKHTFPTIKEAASHFGMPRETLSRKVNGGMSAEDAVNSYLLRKKIKLHVLVLSEALSFVRVRSTQPMPLLLAR